MKIEEQKKTAEFWIDEQGINVQRKRLQESDKLNESIAYKIAKKAAGLNADLIAFKSEVNKLLEKSMKTFLKENGVDKIGKGKGGYTLYNFDKSIKIVVKNNDILSYDDNKLALAKGLLDEFLSEEVSSTKDVIKEMVIGAFSNTKGSVDNKQIAKLISYRTKVKSKKYDEATDILIGAAIVNGSKSYTQVFVRKENGEYEDIQLNWSSI